MLHYQHPQLCSSKGCKLVSDLFVTSVSKPCCSACSENKPHTLDCIYRNQIYNNSLNFQNNNYDVIPQLCSSEGCKLISNICSADVTKPCCITCPKNKVHTLECTLRNQIYNDSIIDPQLCSNKCCNFISGLLATSVSEPCCDMCVKNGHTMECRYRNLVYNNDSIPQNNSDILTSQNNTYGFTPQNNIDDFTTENNSNIIFAPQTKSNSPPIQIKFSSFTKNKFNNSSTQNSSINKSWEQISMVNNQNSIVNNQNSIVNNPIPNANIPILMVSNPILIDSPIKISKQILTSSPIKISGSIKISKTKSTGNQILINGPITISNSILIRKPIPIISNPILTVSNPIMDKNSYCDESWVDICVDSCVESLYS